MKEEKLSILAKTLAGLEEELAAELAELGVQNPVIGTRAVTFFADHETLYRVNLWSRLALRFFRLINSFTIHQAKELYDGIAATQWWKWIGVDQTFRIDNTVSSNFFNNPLYASQLAKDAIVDQFRRRFNVRPSVDKEHPDFTILLAIRGAECTVYLDSSGDALFKRGYRINTVTAPINEVLAAGILRISGWKPETPLIDPMCGSGTFPVEAALMGMNIPPGSNRSFFAFMKWPDFDKFAWRKLKEDVFANQKDVALQIYGYDISSKNLDIARQNIQALRMHKDIALAQADFLSLVPPVDQGVLVINPPYGERLRKANMPAFYKDIGDTMKRNYPGFEAWIVSSDLEALKAIGLKPHARKTLYNGKLECKLLAFRLFK